MFDYLNTPTTALEFDGTRTERLPLAEDSAVYDLSLYAFDQGEEIALAWEYAVDLFDRASVVRMAGAFRSLLSAALSTGCRFLMPRDATGYWRPEWARRRVARWRRRLPDSSGRQLWPRRPRPCDTRAKSSRTGSSSRRPSGWPASSTASVRPRATEWRCWWIDRRHW